MKIHMIAVGSRGDVQPLIALGKGLKRAGHEITIISHQRFANLATEHDLQFALLSTDPKEALEGEAGQSALASGKNPLVQAINFADMLKPMMKQIGDECCSICQDPDLIIYTPLAIFVAPHIAHALEIPSIAALYQHFHPTTQFPSFSIPNIQSYGTILNRLSYSLTDLLFWLPYKNTVYEWLASQALTPAYLKGKNFYKQWLASASIIYGFSPLVIPRPHDWPASVDITGYWFLDRPQTWQPPQALTEFLATGAKPLYIGFGSMLSNDPQATGNMIFDALEQTKQRAIVALGWGGLDAKALPDNVFRIESAPHDWLLPQMCAAIHHGGAGTTAAVIRAGIPSIVTPFYVDQPFWANRVQKLGIGTRAIPHKNLTTKALVHAIQEATTNQQMQETARSLAQRLSEEDGVANAVAAIHRRVATR